MYKPKHFSAVELVDKATYQKYKHKGDAWILGVLFDWRLLRVADILREEYGALTINDWSWGGLNQYRGWRSPDCDIGATLSQHRFGRGLDLITTGHYLYKEIREDIIADQHGISFKDIGGLEMGINWLHIDTRARNSRDEINLFYP